MKLSQLALAISLSPVLALAESPTTQESQFTTPALVVTSGRQSQPRDEATGATTVFTRQDIERLQPSSVPDLLKRAPGVQIVQSGGRGSATSISIRGTKTSQSLVLIDGQRIGSASLGGASLEHLNVAQIERVEVLRGSRSALYGADAIGGVVQIFTRKGTANALSPWVSAHVGSQSTFERSAGISGGDEKTRFSLGASLDETNGINRTDISFPADQDRDAYRNKALSMSLSHQLTDALSAGFSALDQRGKTEYDSPWGRWDDTTFTSVDAQPYDYFVLSSISGWVDWQVNQSWRSRIESGHSEDKMENHDKLFSAVSSFDTYRDSGAWLNYLQLDTRNELLVGIDYNEDSLSSTTQYKEDTRWNQAAFAQHTFKGEHFSTELGLRHDKNQQYGSDNTWNGALTLPVNAINDVLLSYSEGFRVPTFNDLYWPDSCWFGSCSPAANPNLKPEHSKSYELQWRSQLAKQVRLETSIYRTDLRDMIGLDQNFIPQNISQARINGLESSLAADIGDWRNQLSIGLIDARDRNTGKRLTHKAKRTLSYDLDRQFGPYGVGLSWQLASNSFNDPKNTQEIPGYGTLDLRGSWAATNELLFDIKLSNLLDKNYSRALYTHPAGGKTYAYQEEPFGVRIGLTWTPEF